MTEHLNVGTGTIAYDLTGEGPLVVLAQGMGDSRHSYRFIAPALVAAGYRVANVDIRGTGDSSVEWDSYTRTDIANDLIAVIRHLGGPAVIIGQSISGGAATVAAATAPEEVRGLIELAPFTRKQSIDFGALLRNRRHRTGMLRLLGMAVTGNVKHWQKYLDIAYPTKPADYDAEMARMEAKLAEPGRMKVLQKMGQTAATDAGAQLANVRCPVLIVEGDLDPDWDDPQAEGAAVVDALPAGLGEVAVIKGAGHYPHAQTPEAVLELALPFLARTLQRA